MGDEKAQAIAQEMLRKAQYALAGIERQMAVMKWPSEFRAIMWRAIAEIALRRADAARCELQRTP